MPACMESPTRLLMCSGKASRCRHWRRFGAMQLRHTFEKRASPMTRFLWRLTGAMVLNANAYEDVERDESATIQAMAVVLLSSLAAGVGALGGGGNRATDLIGISVVALAVWIIWALLTYEIGTWLLPSPQTHATPGELLRTIGFASAPGIFRVPPVIPSLQAALFSGA